MNTIGITRIVIYTQRMLEMYLAKKEAKTLNLILWVALSVFALFRCGVIVGQSIGELVFNVSR
ncbi:hypothetical protein [Pontibacter arcticus]|uniref:Uncharacterized protein n=1 Tax=Pontibacter arcticus TaxID=2080288 RepID=A0A364RE96_9BACT|nr:hypothetical protein [Pontibacter arcticus]RAU82609.1 hypothetical protein DP923_12655 [Pontibacter arcticus]